MNLVSLPDGRIINLDYLTYAERTGDYVVLHLGGGSDGGSIIRVKQGEGARRVWAHIAGKCAVKIETPRQL
jgi:hydrogenase maturation factor